MAHTNRGRVILGGLLAGVVINIVEYITNGVVLKQAWGEAMKALGKPAELTPGAIVMFNANTAIRAGLAAWALAVFLPNLGNYPLGLFPTRLLVISTGVALVEIVVATVAGAWLYKEKEMEAPAVVRRPAA